MCLCWGETDTKLRILPLPPEIVFKKSRQDQSEVSYQEGCVQSFHEGTREIGYRPGNKLGESGQEKLL